MHNLPHDPPHACGTPDTASLAAQERLEGLAHKSGRHRQSEPPRAAVSNPSAPRTSTDWSATPKARAATCASVSLSSLKLDPLATDKTCEGDAAPSMCASVVTAVGRHSDGRLGLLISPHTHASALPDFMEPTVLWTQ